MKIWVRTDEDGRIYYKKFVDEDTEGLIEIEDYAEPESIEGKTYTEFYRDGKVEAEYEDKFEEIDRIEQLEQAILELSDILLGGD